MMTTGDLENICKSLNREYGQDTSICMQIYSENGHLDGGDYVIDFKVAENGTLFLINRVSQINF